jgi:hypothetical protein
MVLGGLLAVVLGGCEQGNPAVLNVVGNVIPLATIVNGALQCNVTGAQNLYPDGVLDLAVTTAFRFNALVENKLPSSTLVNNSAGPQLRQDVNTIVVDNVRVVFEPLLNDGKTTTSPFNGKGKLVNGKTPVQQFEWSSPTYLTVQPGKTGVASFDLVPTNAAPGLPVGLDWQARFRGFGDARYRTFERVLLRFTLTGLNAGGTTVQSGEVAFPLTVCWGCLLQVAGDPKAEDANAQWNQCSLMAVNSAYQPPCAPGNNDMMPCGYYCGLCKKNESLGQASSACDEKFCPQL